MDRMVVVDCDLNNGRGYVVMADANEFELVMDELGLRIRAPSSDQEVTDPVMHEVVRLQLVREHLLDS